MKRFSFLILFLIPLLLFSQNDSSKGIKWTTGLSWEQVKQKAKTENKYIFIDAYTTWCRPCKIMDKNVYPNEAVGDLINEHFIAVKAQIDKTEKDEQTIKDWYNDAEMIERDFVVKAFPALIFLSPNADIIQKDVGLKSVQDFISIAKEALIPDKIYDNPFREYKTLVDEYNKGIKHYDRMPFMIHKAQELNDTLARTFFTEYLEYASSLNENERYTEENILLWSSFILKLNSKALGFFLKDGDKIDKVMSQEGYSRDIVDKTIQARIVDTFFRMQKGETMTISGAKISNSEIMFVILPRRLDGKPGEPDYVEADWKELGKMIRKSFNSDYAKRNVLTARSRWYEQHQNLTGALKMHFTRLAKWSSAKLEIATNDFAWHTFLYTNDEKLIKEAIKWQEKLIRQYPGRHELLDTYASLLYKLGRTDEAIQWEEKAISVLGLEREDKIKVYKDVIQKMKNGEPTYLKQGAIWINK